MYEFNRLKPIQKFNFKINKFLKTQMLDQMKHKNTFVRLMETEFMFLKVAKSSKNLNNFEHRVVPVIISFKKARCLRKIMKHMQ